ncbi:MAG: HD domain-containing protein [Candidatus Diapherotrites archaeon]|nr:HD domain-containing protein [Candidatus Diapherotrites archaeon]
MVPLNDVQSQLLETPEVRRLAWIHQLSFAKILFPGATHTRLEHVMGTSYLGKTAGRKLGLSEQEQSFLSAAGLLHDVGHAPFSHALEPLLKTTHEEYGTQLILGKSIPDIPGSGRIPGILEDNGINPKELAKTVTGEQKGFKTQIIHGNIDVDRMDYLNRDAHATGVVLGQVDWERLITAYIVKDDDLCIKDNSDAALVHFLISRHHMYRAVYHNYKTRIAGIMLRRAGEQVKDKLEGFEALTDDQYLQKLIEMGGYQKEIATRVKYNQLFEAAYKIRNVGSTQKQKEKTWALFEQGNVEEIIARKAGVNPDYLITDLLTKPPHKRKEPEEMNIKIYLKNGDVKSLYEVSPLAKAISQEESIRTLATFYCLPKDVKNVRKVVLEMLK